MARLSRLRRARAIAAVAQTQFEAWLAMQQPTAAGLRAATGSERRWTIVPIYNANNSLARSLEEMWATRTPAEAYAVLSQPDVTVTNASDKVTQLAKLANLDQLVRAAFRSA